VLRLSAGALGDPEPGAALALKHGVLLLRPRRRDRLVRADLLDLKARFVLVEVRTR
jgi:hypothetical protein